MADLIKSYKDKKSNFEFLTQKQEIQFVESAIDSLSAILMDNELGSAQYKTAHETYTYFVDIHQRLEADMKRQSILEKKNYCQREWWRKNAHHIAEQRKEIREFKQKK